MAASHAIGSRSAIRCLRLTHPSDFDQFEVIRNVASFASAAKFALMGILAGVTIDAMGSKLCRFTRFDMAGGTEQPLMPAG